MRLHLMWANTWLYNETLAVEVGRWGTPLPQHPERKWKEKCAKHHPTRVKDGLKSGLLNVRVACGAWLPGAPLGCSLLFTCHCSCRGFSSINSALQSEWISGSVNGGALSLQALLVPVCGDQGGHSVALVMGPPHLFLFHGPPDSAASSLLQAWFPLLAVFVLPDPSLGHFLEAQLKCHLFWEHVL